MLVHVELLTFLIVVTGVTSGHESPGENWSHLILTQTWPQSVCQKLWEDHRKCHVPDCVKGWTIHGLWTNHRENCNNTWPFHLGKIQDLLPFMNKFWPALKSPNSTSLWAHEWTHHGTCTAQLPSLDSQHKYFSKTIDLYKAIDLAKVLADAGIIPGHRKRYKFDQVVMAIKNALGVKPKLNCLSVPNFQDAQMLAEIQVCHAKDFSLIDCTRAADFDVDCVAKRGDPLHDDSKEFHCNPTKRLYYLDSSKPVNSSLES